MDSSILSCLPCRNHRHLGWSLLRCVPNCFCKPFWRPPAWVSGLVTPVPDFSAACLLPHWCAAQCFSLLLLFLSVFELSMFVLAERLFFVLHVPFTGWEYAPVMPTSGWSWGGGPQPLDSGADPCGLRPQGSLELFACFSTMKDILTYLTGVLWGIVNHSWQNPLGSSMEDALSRSLGFCPHWVVPRLELLSDLGKFSGPHPSSKLLVQMLTVFSWMLES